MLKLQRFIQAKNVFTLILFMSALLVIRGAEGQPIQKFTSISESQRLSPFTKNDHEPPILQNPMARLSASDGSYRDYFSESAVAISGNTIAVGASWDDDGGEDSGSAYIFVRPENGWATMNETAKLTASDAKPNNLFGYTIDISGDTVVIGSGDSIYVFERPQSGWIDATETVKLPKVEDYYSAGIAIDKDTLIVSYLEKDFPQPLKQSFIAVYIRPDTGWQAVSETARLTESNSIGGHIVAIDGNIIVSKKGDDAYIFVRPENGWISTTETAKLIFTDPNPVYHHSGCGKPAISEKMIAFGCSKSDYNNQVEGSVYIFEPSTNGWETTSEVTVLRRRAIHDGTYGLGSSVAIENETLVVGTLQRTPRGVPVYKRTGNDWKSPIETTTLIPFSDAGNFGHIVGISEGIVVVSASGDNNASGSVYVFDLALPSAKVFLPLIIR